MFTLKLCALTILCVFPVHGIISGLSANPGQFPYLASLRVKLESGAEPFHDCGAVILSNEWIVSAARCLVNEKQSDWVIVVGAFKFFGDGNTHEIAEIVMHPKFGLVFDFFDNNIVLVKSATQFELGPSVQPAVISTEFVSSGVKAITAGWGYVSFRPVSRIKHYLEAHLSNAVSISTESRDPAIQLEISPGRHALQR